MKKLIILLTAFVIVLSCNKNVKLSKNLDGETYHIHNIFIDNDTLIANADLLFDNCKSRTKICTGKLIVKDNVTLTEIASAEFQWQFINKGTEFYFSNQTTGTDEAAILSSKISGKYAVTNKTDDFLELESTQLPAFLNKKVRFKVSLKHTH